MVDQYILAHTFPKMAKTNFREVSPDWGSDRFCHKLTSEIFQVPKRRIGYKTRRNQGSLLNIGPFFVLHKISHKKLACRIFSSRSKIYKPLFFFQTNLHMHVMSLVHDKALVSASHLSGALSARSCAAFFQTREREQNKFRNCARARILTKYFCLFSIFFLFFPSFKKFW